MITKSLLTITLTALSLNVASGALISLDLLGRAGIGLLAGNEVGATVGSVGRGGEIGTGITFDNVSNLLSINVGWGTANGFTNLTGAATAAHIHGATAGSAPTSFNENAGVLFGLDSGSFTLNTSAAGGSIVGSTTISASQAGDLLAGRWYVNVHTATNGGGEIRGNIVVPEPTSVIMLGLLGALGAMRRR